MNSAVIYYVVRVDRGDFSNIPISMFGVPALFTDKNKADNFAKFGCGTGDLHEVREWTIPISQLTILEE